jgi:hypothetical protein
MKGVIDSLISKTVILNGSPDTVIFNNPFLKLSIGFNIIIGYCFPPISKT